MPIIEKFRETLQKQHSTWQLFFRIILGLILFAKGIQFIKEATLLKEVVEGTVSLKNFPWLYIIIPWVHFFGGLLILIGLFSRWAAFAQLPIIIGSIFFVSEKSRFLLGHFELPMAIIILLLIFIHIIIGGGVFSWRNLIKEEKNIF